MKKIKLVCFDVDGTLVDGSSWLVLTEGLGCPVQKHLDIYQKCQKGELSFIEGERLLIQMYQNSGNANKTFIKNLFDKVDIRSEAKDLISYLRKKGYIIYLISGATDIYVESVAKKLKADGFYANSILEFNIKGDLQKINYRENQGGVKVEQLTGLIQKLGINIDQVAFVGDSENDVDVFKIIKHGIVVQGFNGFNEKLEKVSWRVVDSLLEIKDIL